MDLKPSQQSLNRLRVFIEDTTKGTAEGGWHGNEGGADIDTLNGMGDL